MGPAAAVGFLCVASATSVAVFDSVAAPSLVAFSPPSSPSLPTASLSPVFASFSLSALSFLAWCLPQTLPSRAAISSLIAFVTHSSVDVDSSTGNSFVCSPLASFTRTSSLFVYRRTFAFASGGARSFAAASFFVVCGVAASTHSREPRLKASINAAAGRNRSVMARRATPARCDDANDDAVRALG